MVYAVDLAAGRQTYYVDGKLVLSAQASAIDGRHSRWVDPPRFVLFGSNTSIGPDTSPAIDVKRVAFYDRALTPAEAISLGPTD